jgi:hypothetical protein
MEHRGLAGSCGTAPEWKLIGARRTPSYRENDREKAQRLQAEAAEALEPAGAAWAQFLFDWQATAAMPCAKGLAGSA